MTTSVDIATSGTRRRFLLVGGLTQRQRAAVVSFLVVQTVLELAYCLPASAHPLDADAWRGMLFIAAKAVSTTVMVYGVLRARRVVARQWRLLLGAVLAWTTVEVVTAAKVVMHLDASGWTHLGVLVFAGYALMSFAVYGLVRREGLVHGAAVGLEVALMGSSYLACWWLLVGHATVYYGGIRPESLFSGLYPLGDLLAIASVVTLVSSRTGGEPALRSLSVANIAAVGGDLIFAISGGGTGSPLVVAAPLLWMVEYTALATGALTIDVAADVETVQRLPMTGIALVMAAVTAPAAVAASAGHLSTPPLDTDQLAVAGIATVVVITLAVLRVRRLLHELEARTSELEQSARTDELTRLPNRRAGDRMLSQAVQAGLHEGTPVMVAMLDLDHFKAYNDRHGHLQGDRLLRLAATSWTSALAERGQLYRYGGEEFTLILTGTQTPHAEHILDQLRAATPHRQTFSAGTATLRTEDTPHTLLARADTALYAAKTAGRARTTAA